MTNPVFFEIEQHDGSKRTVIIEPVLERSVDGIKNTGSYKIYKSSIDNQSSLFTEKLEIDEKNDDLPDANNPDYLGSMTVPSAGGWHYEGDLLSDEEQLQVMKKIIATVD